MNKKDFNKMQNWQGTALVDDVIECNCVNTGLVHIDLKFPMLADNFKRYQKERMPLDAEGRSTDGQVGPW